MTQRSAVLTSFAAEAPSHADIESFYNGLKLISLLDMIYFVIYQINVY